MSRITKESSEGNKDWARIARLGFLVCLLALVVVFLLLGDPDRVAGSKPGALGQPDKIRGDKGKDSTDRLISAKKLGVLALRSGHSNAEALLTGPARRGRSAKGKQRRALKGEEAWEKPRLEHCKELLDLSRFVQTTPVHVLVKKTEDGQLDYEVKALGDCVPQDLFDSVDLEIPACEEGIVPTTLKKMSECESARISFLQELPKNLSFNAKGELEYYYFLNPANKDEQEGGEPTQLPEAVDDVSQLPPEELQKVSHTLRLQRKAQAHSGVPLVVCADYELFSRDLYENLVVILTDFPSVELYWVVSPLKNDPSSLNLAIAGAAAASLGFQWEANRLLFDMAGAKSPQDIALALSGLGVDTQRLLELMRSQEIRQKVSNSIRWCEEQGMSSTPTMKFGGQIQVGARRQEQLRVLLSSGATED